MKKLLGIVVLGLLFGGSASSEEIKLDCMYLSKTGKSRSVFLYINTEYGQAVWQGWKKPVYYFLDKGNFKYSMTKKDKKKNRKARHSLNRNTGKLKVELYNFDDEKKVDKLFSNVKDELSKAGKTFEDTAYFTKIYYEKLGDFKSDFEANFNCETSK